MLIVLLDFGFIGICCLISGAGISRVFRMLMSSDRKAACDASPAQMMMTGVAVLTVYAEWMSIFLKIGGIVHFLMLILLAVCAFLCRDDLRGALRSMWETLRSVAGPVLIFAILLIAFFCSRGQYHTDTGIYHAHMIRLYEEYGVLRGMGNLQVHFAYNSAYFAFCALFTGNWILPPEMHLHATTGFLTALLFCYAFCGLLRFREHDSHLGDGIRVAIFVYILTELTGTMSPASDYGTMYLTLFVLAMYADAADIINEEVRLDRLAAAALLGIFTITSKLSGGFLVLLTLYPLIRYVARKQFRRIGVCSVTAILSVLPWLIRNYLISGWLLYPSMTLDLFDVPWKIPVPYVEIDRAGILATARRIDRSLNSLPLKQWVPLWWETKEHYEEMLAWACLCGTILLLICAVMLFIREKRIRTARIVMWLSVYASIVLWFFEAPEYRFALGFLLVIPLGALGTLAEEIRCRKKAGGGKLFPALYIPAAAAFLIPFFMAAWIDHYYMDDLMFIKTRVSSPYYLLQQPFPDNEMYPIDMDGETVWAPVQGEVNSYYYPPSTCYDDMAERTKLIGDTIEQGFMPR